MTLAMNYATPDKDFIQNAFNTITPKYDRLNQILSFGMAEGWRKKAAEILLADPDFSPQAILDLGCGTGKFLECFLRRREQQVPASVPVAQATGVKTQAWARAVGVDFSREMLQKARETVAGDVLWLEEDFDKLPFLDSSFDLVVSAFALRSTQNLPEFLAKVYRILTPKGKVGFLELTRPRSFLCRLLFYPYLRIYLPVMGRLISGNSTAYQFLSHSVESFQPPERILEQMEQAGFRGCRTKSFSFGAATLIIASK